MDQETDKETDEKKDRKKRRHSSASSDDEEEVKRRMLEAAATVRPAVLQNFKTGVLDVVTGGYGSISAPDQGPGMKVCTRYLGGGCPMETGCPLSHPKDPADCMRWIQYFNSQPCKNGAQCILDKCLYEHPHKPSWRGIFDQRAALAQRGTTL